MSVEVEFIDHPFPAACAAGEINIEKAETRMDGGDNSPLHIKFGLAHTQLNIQWLFLMECHHTAISRTLCRIPCIRQSQGVRLCRCQLLGPGFHLLETQEVRILPPSPVQCAFIQGSPHAVYVPGYYFHRFHFMVNYLQVFP